MATKVSDSKERTIRVRLTDEQRAQLREAAQADDLEISTWVRRAALAAAVKVAARGKR